MVKLADPPPPRDYVIPDLSQRGEKVRVSYSELATFRDCPLKWQLKYFWRLKGPDRILRLDRGIAWHLMLERHYEAVKVGASREEARKAVFDALNDYDRLIGGMEHGEFETLTWMYDDYVRIYRSDARFEIVRTEAEFEFPMPVPGAPGLVIVGKIDLETLDRERGTRQVWDHKSASKRDVSKDGFLNEMLLEDQFILYAKAKALGGEPVDSVIYSAARTDKLKRAMLDSERFIRKRMFYPDAALEDVWNDNVRAASALVAMWDDPDLVYSVPNPRQCGWKCDFQKVHVSSRDTGRPITQVAIDYGFQFKDRTEREPAVEPDPETSGW